MVKRGRTGLLFGRKLIPMHTKWTAVLLTTALAGGLAATTGTAATALPVPPAHPVAQPVGQPVGQPAVRPAVALPDPGKTLDVLGALGGLLKSVSALVGAILPPAPAATPDAAALKEKLTQLQAEIAKLKGSLPPATAPTLPSPPGLPVPAPLGTGQTADRISPPLPVGSVEDQLAALDKDAAALIAAATAKKPDPDSVKAALTPLSTDSLGVSTATVTRLTGA